MEHTGDADQPLARLDVSRFSDRASRETLQQVVDLVTEMVGFGVAVINIVLADTMTTVTVSQDQPAIGERLLGARTPAELILAELDRSENWGRFRFVPHDRVHIDVPAWGWRSDDPPLDHPDAWHPDDLLLAPLYAESGDLIGFLSTDLPLDGLRPGPQQRQLLEKYAEQAERALRSALHRDEVQQQFRLTDTARRLVRAASSQPSLEQVIEESRGPLAEGFVSVGSWIQVFDVHGIDRGEALLTDGSTLEIPAELVRVAHAASSKLWASQEAAVTGPTYAEHPVITSEEHAAVHEYLTQFALDSIMFVPLGAGQDTFGILVLARTATDRRWTPIETVSALEIGRDLGAAILNARAFEKERRLVEDLQSLDSYKSELISTVSHELKSPLTAIMGHLELLSQIEEVPDSSRASVAAMARGSVKLTGLVNDLLLLARVDSPSQRTMTDVDLAEVASRAVDHSMSAPDSVSVRLIALAGVFVQGNASELERLVATLLENAVRYGARSVTVEVELREGDALLRVADDGIGISQDDLLRVFDEFFRSSDPAVLELPGSGLGLSIAARIAERHGGRVSAESTLGVGSTFTVCFPRKGRASRVAR